MFDIGLLGVGLISSLCSFILFSYTGRPTITCFKNIYILKFITWNRYLDIWLASISASILYTGDGEFLDTKKVLTLGQLKHV